MSGSSILNGFRLSNFSMEWVALSFEIWVCLAFIDFSAVLVGFFVAVLSWPLCVLYPFLVEFNCVAF